MSDVLVSEANLYTMGHYPLARDTLHGFELDRRLEEVEYMPQLGFLALKESANSERSLVGFRAQGGEVLYSHPNAVLALPGSNVVDVCSVSLPKEPKIVDTRIGSRISWSGRITQGAMDLLYRAADSPSLDGGADIIIESQPLWEGMRQAAFMRTTCINRFLPSSIARIANPALKAKTLGWYA